MSSPLLSDPLDLVILRWVVTCHDVIVFFPKDMFRGQYWVMSPNTSQLFPIGLTQAANVFSDSMWSMNI